MAQQIFLRVQLFFVVIVLLAISVKMELFANLLLIAMVFLLIFIVLQKRTQLKINYQILFFYILFLKSNKITLAVSCLLLDVYKPKS